jgi:hypothetical protein
VHPLDVHGKTPINLAKGVFPVSGGAVSSLTPVTNAGDWKVAKNVPGNTLGATRVVTAAPERVSRTLAGGDLGARVVNLGHSSSIAYDAREHRFVNTNSTAAAHPQNDVAANLSGSAKTGIAVEPAGPRTLRVSGGVPENPRTSAPPARASIPSRAMTPPPSPRSFASAHGSYSGGGGGSFAPSHASSASSSAPSHGSSGGTSSGGRGH